MKSSVAVLYVGKIPTVVLIRAKNCEFNAQKKFLLDFELKYLTKKNVHFDVKHALARFRISAKNDFIGGFRIRLQKNLIPV